MLNPGTIPPSIAWLIAGNEAYGLLRAVLTLSAALADRGWTVSILSLEEGPAVEQCRRQRPVQVLGRDLPSGFGGPLLQRPRQVLRNWKASRQIEPLLVESLRSCQADAVQVLVPSLLPLAARAAKRLGIACVWEMPNILGAHYPLGVNRWMYQLLCRRHDVTVIANSRYTAASFGAWPVAPSVMHLGLDVARLEACGPMIGRRELGLPDGATVLAVAARLTPAKGQDRLLAALLRLLPEHPDLHLLLLGGPLDGTYATRLQQMAAEVGASDRLRLLGEVTEPQRYYSAVDVALHCAPRAEPFGLSVLEAMLFERPVLAHGEGGPMETVLDGLTGWASSATSVDALEHGLRRVLAERARWPELGRNGRQHVLRNFTAERQADRYCEIVLPSLKACQKLGPSSRRRLVQAEAATEQAS